MGQGTDIVAKLSPGTVFQSATAQKNPLFAASQRLRDFAGVRDEKLSDGAERAILSG